MGYYMSMQGVRFRSPNDYDRFKMLWKEVGKHLKDVEGLISVTWWTHPDDPELFNEISIWESKEATENWHNHGFHKQLKIWGFSGTIIEDMVVNWESVEAHILRKCPVCGAGKRADFELRDELKTKQIPCVCGFTFPYLDTTPTNFAFYRPEA